MIPAYGHVVLRFVTDNPGLWAFHCHIVWHTAAGGGLLMQIASLPSSSSLKSLVYAIPQTMRDQCAALGKLGGPAEGRKRDLRAPASSMFQRA